MYPYCSGLLSIEGKFVYLLFPKASKNSGYFAAEFSLTTIEHDITGITVLLTHSASSAVTEIGPVYVARAKEPGISNISLWSEK